MKPFLFTPLVCFAFLFAACGDSPSCTDTSCDDGNPCTADSCDPEAAICEHIDLPDQSDCDLGGSDGLCSAGLCASLSCDDTPCDDSNPCTLDACFPPSVNCAHFPLPALSVCEVDGSFGICQQSLCDFDFPPSGGAQLNVIVTGVEARIVSYVLTCASDLRLSGNLARSDDQWQVSLTLPAGRCQAQFSAMDQDGETICVAELGFDVPPGARVPVDVVLICSVQPKQ